MIEKNCKSCGEVYKTYKSHVRHRGSNFCSRKCKGKWMSLNQLADKNPSWKGGVSPLNHRLRNSMKWKRWREKVFGRDDYVCQECGTRGGYLEPHHLKFWSEFIRGRFWVTNGVTLCRECHRYVHRQERKFRKLDLILETK